MARIEIYSKAWCGYCRRAKTLLNGRGLPYLEIDVTNDRGREIEMRQRSGRRSVPQIFVDGKCIGGHDELVALLTTGGLARLHESEQSPGQAAE